MYSRPSRTCLLAVATVLATLVPASAGPRRNLAAGLAVEANTLVIASPTGELKVDVAGWEPVPDAGADIVALARRKDGQREAWILDRHGKTLGTVSAPSGWIPAATDGGVVLVPEASHAPVAAYVLRFLSYEGELRRQVEEPDLLLRDSRIMPGGRFVTVSSKGVSEHDWTVLAYDAFGTEIWRQDVTGDQPPEALLTADGKRLLILQRDIGANTSTVTVLRPGRRAKVHRLPMVALLVGDLSSARVAAVGERVVALIDAASLKLKWRRDDPLDVPLRGGVRFDRRAPRLFVVAAEENRPTKRARLQLHTYRLGDGSEERSDLGDVPLERLPPVADIDVMPNGDRRVILHDRAVIVDPKRAAR